MTGCGPCGWSIDMIGEQVYQIARQTGYPNTKSLEFLHHLVSVIDPDCVLELGTAYGASAAFMASAVKDGGLVVSVDDYRYPDKTPEMVRANLGGCSLLDKVMLINGNTWNVADLLRTAQVRPEIVFMDASHDHEGLHKEYESLLWVLPDRHVVVVDDVFLADDVDRHVARFVLDLANRYGFCLTIKGLHQGMAVLFNDAQYLSMVNDALGLVD